MVNILSGDRYIAVAHKITTSPPKLSKWHKLRCLSSMNFDPLLVKLKKKRQNKRNSSRKKYQSNFAKTRKTETQQKLIKNPLVEVLKSIEASGQDNYLSPNDGIHYQQVQEMVDDVAPAAEESRRMSHNGPAILQNNEDMMQDGIADTKEHVNIAEGSQQERNNQRMSIEEELRNSTPLTRSYFHLLMNLSEDI